MLLIGPPEEPSIVEAGAQHAFVAVTNQALRIAVRIQHGEKIRQQFAFRVLDCEIFLMISHYRHQHLFRKVQKFAIKAAKNSRRPLGEIHDCIQQRCVFAPSRAGNGAGCGIERFANLLLALGTRKHFSGAQGFHVRGTCARNVN